MRYNMSCVEVECVVCNTYFDTLVVFNDFCCSMECYETYYSLEYIRDRKINNILNYGSEERQ